MTTDISKWGDQHQYLSTPLQVDRTEEGNILPKVHLLWMTPDPLGAVAAMGRMYKGIPTYHMSDITDDERRDMWEQCKRTHLQAPLEAIKLHFFIEGVTRSFTHQMVRQRTAVYAQESLRFAVVDEELADRVSLPPSLARLKADDPRRTLWDRAVNQASQSYHALVNAGIPAEDARGLLPHATTTRLNFITDFRNLKDHMGNRLCTQAQFEWRLVAMGIMGAIWDYDPGPQQWQYELIAHSEYFRPVCYHLNHCPFQADFDRSCTIRRRVEDHAHAGQSSDTWADIDVAEWMLDPSAARLQGGAGHD